LFWRSLTMKILPHQRESGAGLTIVMFATAMISAIIVTMTTMTENQIKERVVEARKMQRFAAYEFVKASLNDPAAMRVSAGYDSNLRACIGLRRDRNNLPLNQTQCTAGITAAAAVPQMRAFRLFVPFSAVNHSVQISASSLGDPRGFYDKRGRMVPGNCSPSINCPYKILTWYWAQCPNNTQRCGEAVRVFSFAQIRQVADIEAGPKGREFPKGFVFPPDSERTTNPYKYSSFILTSDVADSIYMNCPPGSVLVGTSSVEDPSGNAAAAPLNLAKCACAQGYAIDRSKGDNGYDRATGWPFCQMQLCDARRGEVLSEIDINGEIRCMVPNAPEYVCTRHSTPSYGIVNCPTDHKMRGIDQGDDCLVIDNIVQCNDMVITCCRKR
jgi:hypothetical protein